MTSTSGANDTRDCLPCSRESAVANALARRHRRTYAARLHTRLIQISTPSRSLVIPPKQTYNKHGGGVTAATLAAQAHFHDVAMSVVMIRIISTRLIILGEQAMQ